MQTTNCHLTAFANKCCILIVFIFLSATESNAQLFGGSIHGNVQLDGQYYLTDSLIGAPDVPEHFLSNCFANFIYERNNLSNVVNLKDSQIISSEKIDENETDDAKEKRTKEELSFIKKHIKFKASELFFADAIIFVEGITEEVLLSYYISKDSIVLSFLRYNLFIVLYPMGALGELFAKEYFLGFKTKEEFETWKEDKIKKYTQQS